MHSKTYNWGPGRMTFKSSGPGWQATCPRKCSHKAHGKHATFCKSYISLKPGFSEEDDLSAQRRLKHWLNCCGMFHNRIEHQNFRPSANDLPSDEALVASCLPDDYDSDVDSDGNPRLLV